MGALSNDQVISCYETANEACQKWYAYQNVEELEFALRTVKLFNPKVIVEIGIANGASLAAWAEVSNPDLVIGIDPLTNPKDEKQKASFDGLVEKYNIKLIPWVDRVPEAHNELKTLLNGRKIDFLFIDGDHGYQSASYDFQAYRPYLNVPSLVGFHDIYYSDGLMDGGSQVGVYWDRIIRESNWNYASIHNFSSMGIGMIKITEQNRGALGV